MRVLILSYSTLTSQSGLYLINENTNPKKNKIMQEKMSMLSNKASFNCFRWIPRSLKITSLCLALSASSVYATTSELQTPTVTINVTQRQTKDVIKQIEEQSNYLFVYNTKKVKLDKTVSVNVTNQPVNEVLDKIFSGTNIEYVIQGKNILLQIKAAGSTQDRKITGTVVDESGMAIIGANILVKGTMNGTVTDIDGNFSLNVNDDDVLNITYIGYKSKELRVGSKKNFSVTLQSDTEALEEVVVVGYGVQKKVNLTGAVSVVEAKSLSNRPLTNSTQALQGTQGLYVNQAGGQPGRDRATIRIRGVGTLNNNDPLILVDGVASSLDDVNPNDIASVSVLKDAASSAIYGSRAANGVILVTTKKADKEGFTVQYNNNFGVQKVTYLPDAVWDPIAYMEGFNVAYRNEGQKPIYSDEMISEYREGMKTNPYVYPAQNWFDLVFKDAFMMEHNVRVAGGTEKLKTSVSIGYLDQKGVVIGTDNKKISLNFNSVATIGRLKTGINVSATYRNFNESHSGTGTFMNYTMRSAPIFAPYTEDGRYGRSWLVTPGQNVFYNMLAHIEEGKNNHKKTRALGSIFAEYTFPLGIQYKITLAANKTDEMKSVFTPVITTYQPKTLAPQSDREESSAANYSYNHIDPSVLQTLTWKGNFKKHEISSLLGMSYEEFNYYSFSGSAEGFLDNSLKDVNAGSKNFQASGYGERIKLLSYFGRLNYSFADRYLFEANFRVDGSSRFAPGNRWGVFPSFSAAWRINQESFMKNVDWISNLKLRASWGQLGNQEIDLYQYVPTIALDYGNTFGTTVSPGGAVNAAVDPEISWETSSMVNVGIDFGLFNHLNGTLEFFKKRTSDILRRVNLPGQVGNLSGPYRNIGTVDNTGIEFGLNYNNKIGDFNYNIYGNLTHVKNEVVDLKGQELYSGPRITKEGEAIDSYYLYECEGIFQSEDEIKKHAFQSNRTAPGDLKFKDLDGDGKITSDDRKVVSGVIPDLTYSFGFNLNYKGIGLNAFFQGVQGVSTLPKANLAAPYNNGASVTWDWLNKSWTEDNRDGGYPRLMRANSGHDNYSKNSTFWLKDASYLRLKNVQLSYTFPQHWLQKIHLRKLTVFVNAENLLTFSKFKESDPERTLTGGNLYQYPSVKSMSAGLNVTF